MSDLVIISTLFVAVFVVINLVVAVLTLRNARRAGRVAERYNACLREGLLEEQIRLGFLREEHKGLQRTAGRTPSTPE